MSSIFPWTDFVNYIDERAAKEDKPKGDILREVLETLKEKDHPLTDQSKENDHENTFRDIIPQNQDIDGEEIYDIESGKTIMDLDYFNKEVDNVE